MTTKIAPNTPEAMRPLLPGSILPLIFPMTPTARKTNPAKINTLAIGADKMSVKLVGIQNLILQDFMNRPSTVLVKKLLGDILIHGAILPINFVCLSRTPDLLFITGDISVHVISVKWPGHLILGVIEI